MNSCHFPFQTLSRIDTRVNVGMSVVYLEYFGHSITGLINFVIFVRKDFFFVIIKFEKGKLNLFLRFIFVEISKFRFSLEAFFAQ